VHTECTITAGADAEGVVGGAGHYALAMLDDRQIDAALSDLPGWGRAGESLTKTYTLPGGFSAAVAWVARLAEIADRADHHPDVAISWNRVTVSWSTHSAGGITARDVEMAGRTDALVADG
jgi:4a-hydroxytetrahydrobiopterin dehydratase